MRKQMVPIIVILSALLLATLSCKKEHQAPVEQKQPASANKEHGGLTQTKTYSSEMVVKWMNIQLRLMATTTGVANVAFTRPFAYSGIALYEALVEGMPSYQSIAPQLNGLSELPSTGPGLAYHWAACANAALAAINKQLFPSASSMDKAAVDSLETALNVQFSSETSDEIFNRSKKYGKAIAQKILAWSETDGYLNVNGPYTPPTGAGLWLPPSVPLPQSSTPYWGSMRPLVRGSGDNAQPVAPTVYSEDPSSEFYKMAKEVYEVSQALTPAQTAMALYWRDVPGVTTPGHYVSILKQVLENENTTLDKAAIGYVLCGIVVFDASVSCWQTKYQYNVVRPITYIRTVLGHTSWSSLLATPAHPEYSSAHAVLSSADAEALTTVFGDHYSFTDHTYDYLGMASRSFGSFRAFGEEAGNSRLYAGIHYQPSINAGLEQGRYVAQNIINKLKFKK